MASKRKPNNMKARMDRTMRGLLRQHRACIVDASVPEVQVIMHYNTGRQIISPKVSGAMCNVAHHWTVNVIVLCVAHDGERYLKRTEFETASIYLASHLGDEVERQYLELVATCNSSHVIGNAWIAIPDHVTLDQQQVERVLDTVGAWRQQAAA